MDVNDIKKYNPNVQVDPNVQVNITKNPTETTIQVTKPNYVDPYVLPPLYQPAAIPPYQPIPAPYQPAAIPPLSTSSSSTASYPASVPSTAPNLYTTTYTQPTSQVNQVSNPVPANQKEKYTDTPILSLITEPVKTLVGGAKFKTQNKTSTSDEIYPIETTSTAAPGAYPDVIQIDKQPIEDTGPGFWTIILWVLLLIAIVILIYWIIKRIKQRNEESQENNENHSECHNEYNSATYDSCNNEIECTCGNNLYENTCHYPHACNDVTYITSETSNLNYESVSVNAENLYYTSEGEIDPNSCLAQCENNPNCTGVVYTENSCNLIMGEVNVDSNTTIIYKGENGYGMYMYDCDKVKNCNNIYVYSSDKPNNYHTCKSNSTFDSIKKAHVEKVNFIPTNVINPCHLKGVWSVEKFCSSDYDKLVNSCNKKGVYVDKGKSCTIDYKINFPSCFYSYNHLYVMYK